MKKYIISIIDTAAFIILGAVFVIAVAVVLMATWFLLKRRHAGKEVNRFSFAIFDPTTSDYPSMAEETLLGGFLSGDFLLYLNFSTGRDHYEEVIPGKVHLHTVAAHPDNGIYKSGFRRVSSLMVEIKLLRKAVDIVSANRISFIKAHDPHLLGLNGLIISKIFRLPSALHMNSNFDEKYRGTGRISSPIFISRGIEKIFESFIINSYDVVMADREFYKHARNFPKSALSKYTALGVRVDRKHYSEPGSRKDMRGELGLEGKRIVLYVGRLHPVKYTDDAVRAMAMVKKEEKDAVLLLVGTGVLQKDLQEIARQNNMEDSVIFLGLKSHEELLDIFYTADVLVAPHGGVTLVESALASTPIVAYDFDWHSEFLEDKKMGYLVPFGDINGLAEKILALFKDNGMRERMGDFCRQRALVKCSRDMSMEREKGIYSRLVRR